MNRTFTRMMPLAMAAGMALMPLLTGCSDGRSKTTAPVPAPVEVAPVTQPSVPLPTAQEPPTTAPATQPQQPAPTTAAAEDQISPADYYNMLMKNRRFQEKEAGEGWAWYVQWGMGQFAHGYHVWKDPQWIDYGVQYCDFAVSRMRTGPDGYKGWIGAHIITNNPDQRNDTHMGDAILIRYMLELAEIIKSDPSLMAKYSQKLDEWIKLAKVDLFEKWDSRGTYNKVGEFGAYVFWDGYMNADLTQLSSSADPESAMTQQFNKQTAMGINALRLYRLTGEEKYRQRAMELFGLLKSRMHHYNDAYCWNFREPAVASDVISVERNELRTWMEPHPKTAAYQAAEVDDIVEAYHSGIVFDEQDIRRIITNHLPLLSKTHFGRS